MRQGYGSWRFDRIRLLKLRKPVGSYPSWTVDRQGTPDLTLPHHTPTWMNNGLTDETQRQQVGVNGQSVAVAGLGRALA